MAVSKKVAQCNQKTLIPISSSCRITSGESQKGFVQQFLCTMVNKLFERSPLWYVVLLSAAKFDPNIVLNKSSKQKRTLCLISLLKHIFGIKHSKFETM